MTRTVLAALLVSATAFAEDFVHEWNEMRHGKLVIGRQFVDPATGDQRTEFFDSRGQALPEEFVLANQRTWGGAGRRVPAEKGPARPAERPRRRPLSLQAGLATNSVSVMLAAPDLGPILEQDRRNQSDAKGPLRIGFFRELPAPVVVSPQERGRWFDLPDGSKLWLMLLSSPGAEGIRLLLSDMALPPGTQFSTYDPGQPGLTTEIHTSTGPDGTVSFWTETTFSSKVALEVIVPPGADVSKLQFTIGRIVHVYAKLSDWARPKEGSCHNDVSCYPEWSSQAAAVAGLGSIGDDGFLFCTGCLLADSDTSTVVNYFMTANHCVENQAQADTLEFYWFFQTSTCNGAPPDAEDVPRTTGGADYLAGSTRNAGSDFAFLRMRQNPPGGVSFAGWSTDPLASSEAVTGIHHPDGAYKRISFGNFVRYSGNFTDVRWFSGVTEPGSSGSPLFNADQLFVGQLYGGQSYCFRPNGIDEYGRFDISFPIIEDYLSSSSPQPPPPPPPSASAPPLLHFEDARDFDGDGDSDLAIYHPAGGTWYFMKSSAGISSRPFGFDPTIQALGDFDSDNRSDLVIYHPESGTWYILTAAEAYSARQFGYRATLPVPGDYDGDGVTDIGVFDPADGNWYLMKSAEGFAVQNFGFAGVTPLPDDYDGDGRTDFCVYDAAGATWYFLQSSEGFRSQQFGFGDVAPSPSDFDGDSRADVAVFDSATANWYALQSTRGFTNVQFGSAGGFPVPADYDDDGKEDFATYLLDTGVWLIRKSSGGVRTNQFGWAEAPPVGLRP